MEDKPTAREETSFPANDEGELRKFFVHFGAFVIVAIGAFFRANDLLLSGWDGYGSRVYTRQMFQWSSFGFSLENLPFQGLGVFLPFNIHLIPSYLTLGHIGGDLGVSLAFLVSALLQFTAVYLLGRALRLPVQATMIGAWSLPAFSLGFFSPFNIYPIFLIAVHVADIISIATLMVAVFGLAMYSKRINFFLAVLLFLLFIIFLCSEVICLVFFLHIFTIFGIAFLFVGKTRPDFFLKCVITLALPVAIMALGGAAYVYGLYDFTAVNFFHDDFNAVTKRTPYHVSVIFHGWGPGRIVAILALAGALVAAISEREATRLLARAFLVALVVLGAYGTYYFVSTGPWGYIYPLYTEVALWPFYFLYAGYALWRGWSFAQRFQGFLLPAVMSRASDIFRYFSISPVRVYLLAGAGALLLLANPIYFTTSFKETYFSTTPFIRLLREEVSLTPGKKFRGNVATFTGFGGPEGPATNWFALQGSNAKIANVLGNPHRMISLWWFDIPTVEEYSMTISPFFYAAARTFLSRPQDLQYRNVLTMTRPRVGYLQNLGARFLVTDFQISDPAVLRETMEVPEGDDFRLYELPEPNIGNYSPTEIIVADSAQKMLAILGAGDFDFQRTAVLGEQVDVSLVQAKEATLIMDKDEYRFTARSDGYSLVVLPLQYNNCLKLDVQEAESEGAARLLRANLSQAALLFEKKINVTLSMRYGPFINSSCRLMDSREARSLHLEAALTP
ncbi:MAG: hypothetical protein ISR48_00480 [Alphaproteobacteria bacterium]|nr:hypothetical protein [Alphaproteobacteria bacterium]